MIYYSNKPHLQEGENMDDRIRVLILKNSMDIGALESHIIRILRIVDKSKVKFDFLLENSNCFHKKEIQQLEGGLYTFDSSDIAFSRDTALIDFINQRRYHIVIRVVESIYDLQDFCILDTLKIPTIIARLSMDLCLNSTDLWHQLEPATLVIKDENSNYVVPLSLRHKTVEIRNALQLEKYRFNLETRNRYREEMHLQNHFVIGNVARFYEAKNHKFLISIFRQFNQIYPDSKLLLVGDGELRGEIEKQISQYQLEDKVLLLGMRNDISNILMAMDVFCLSSYEENTTNSILEAQASGLSCIASDSITTKANITGDVQYISLDDPEHWNKALFEIYHTSKNHTRTFSFNVLKQNGFDMTDVVDILSKRYKQMKDPL